MSFLTLAHSTRITVSQSLSTMAHSGQSGRTSAKMNLALSGLASEEEQDNEDKINAMCEGRKLLKNASYFAFTATPKNKTLETFGTPYQEGDKSSIARSMSIP